MNAGWPDLAAVLHIRAQEIGGKDGELMMRAVEHINTLRAEIKAITFRELEAKNEQAGQSAQLDTREI